MTIVLPVDPHAPDPATIARAAEVIRAGGLVAMPTETVYGLAANALDPAAIGRVFAAKGRPSQNPLIAHVASLEEARALAAEWPAMAQELASRFWPGPLTLVLRRKAVVPDLLTAGLDTFGVRVPDHPVALALIRAAGTPLAAPSANRFTEVSPVTATQVVRGLRDRVDLVLDAGRTPIGIESTVVDVSGATPVLLRPGMIGRATIERVVGPTGRASTPVRADTPLRSPGMAARHYAPRARVRLVHADDLQAALDDAAERTARGTRVGAIAHSVDPASGRDLAFARRLPGAPAAFGAGLYDALHDADAASCDDLVIERVPDGPEWDAIRDRLTRAAHPG